MPSFTLETEANGQSTQARLAARFLRLAAATVDPDPVEV